MSTLLYIENPIVLSGTAETPIIDGLEKQSGEFREENHLNNTTSTTKLFLFSLYTDEHPRQLWEYKFKINSSKITSSHVGSLIDYNDWWYIPQILINTDGELVIYIEYPVMQVIDPATGLPLWWDPDTNEATTKTPFTPEGSIDMTKLITTGEQYGKYKITLAKDQYYTLKMIFDHNTHYITILLNNTAIVTQLVKFVDHTMAYQFENCEFLDVDYFKLIDLNDINQSSSFSTGETFTVTKTIANKSDTPIQDGVM